MGLITTPITTGLFSNRAEAWLELNSSAVAWNEVASGAACFRGLRGVLKLQSGVAVELWTEGVKQPLADVVVTGETVFIEAGRTLRFPFLLSTPWGASLDRAAFVRLALPEWAQPVEARVEVAPCRDCRDIAQRIAGLARLALVSWSGSASGVTATFEAHDPAHPLRAAALHLRKTIGGWEGKLSAAPAVGSGRRLLEAEIGPVTSSRRRGEQLQAALTALGVDLDVQWALPLPAQPSTEYADDLPRPSSDD